MILLSGLGWGQFIGLLVLGTAVYYGIVGWLCYQDSIKSFWQRPEAVAGEEEIPVLMGAARPLEGLEEVAPEDLVFDNSADAIDVKLGLVPDLLEEVKALLEMAAETAQDKQGVLDVLRLVSPKIAQLEEVQQDRVAGFIITEVGERFNLQLALKEVRGLWSKKQPGVGKAVMAVLLGLLLGQAGWAADGNAGIQQATQMVKGYFDTGCDLMYAIGAIVGIIGGVKVFQKWNAGEPDTSKVAASWFGSCIFLVVVATVIRSFFGL